MRGSPQGMRPWATPAHHIPYTHARTQPSTCGKLCLHMHRHPHCLPRPEPPPPNSRHGEAITLLQEVVKAAPNLPDPYHTLGALHDAAGNARKALDFWMIAAHLTPRVCAVCVRGCGCAGGWVGETAGSPCVKLVPGRASQRSTHTQRAAQRRSGRVARVGRRTMPFWLLRKKEKLPLSPAQQLAGCGLVAAASGDV